MSFGVITCQICHKETEDAGIIRASVAGDENQVQVFICEECERMGREPGATLVETVKRLIMRGIRNWMSARGLTDGGMQRYCLASDNDGHWYVVPVSRQKEFYESCDAVEAFWSGDESKGMSEIPQWAFRVGGSPARVSFIAFHID